MASESTIKVQVQGEDKASQQIKNVAKSLSELNIAANENAAKMAKGGDAIRSAMGAASGSITGVLGSVKGMSSAITAMGMSMSAALPIAAAVAAAIWALKKAWDAYQAEQKHRIEQLEKENDLFVEQMKTVESLRGKWEKVLSVRRQIAQIEDKIAGRTSNYDKAHTESINLTGEISTLERVMASLKQQMDEAEAKIAKNTSDMEERSYYEDPNTGEVREAGYILDEDTRKALAEANQKINEERKKLLEQYEKIYVEDLPVLRAKLELANKEAAEAAAESMRKNVGNLWNKFTNWVKKGAEAGINALKEEKKSLEKELAGLERVNQGLKLSNLFQANSHSTHLLLKQLDGLGNDSTTADVSRNVQSIRARLDEINMKLEQLGAV